MCQHQHQQRACGDQQLPHLEQCLRRHTIAFKCAKSHQVSERVVFAKTMKEKNA